MVMSSVFMNQQYTPNRGRENSPICTSSTKATSVVCDKVIEKMEKELNLWIYEMTTDEKNVDSILVILKVKAI